MENQDTIKIAIVISEAIRSEASRSKLDIVSKTIIQLKEYGIDKKEIELYYVPTDLDVAYGCSVVFDHLLVDGIVALSSKYNAIIADKLIDLGIECDIPIEYRWEGMPFPEKSGVVGMIAMIDDVLMKAGAMYEPEDMEAEFVEPQKEKKSSKVN